MNFEFATKNSENDEFDIFHQLNNNDFCINYIIRYDDRYNIIFANIIK